MKWIIILVILILLLIFVPAKSNMLPEPGRESEEITGTRTFASIQIDNNEFKFYK
jgi:hypothetical protein